MLGGFELNRVYQYDCIEALKLLPENSIDSIVTDPPYELGFMGKAWDSTGITFNIEFWKECLRVLKHGGHLLSFGGTRTYHRMVCAIEDAGFEIRDQIQWIYGSGFPKSTDISKQLKKIDENISDYWKGWGTGLKPAHEPIVMARKPLSEKTIAKNVVKWNTGGINIDDCRIRTDDKLVRPEIKRNDNNVYGTGLGAGTQIEPKGRFPANVILDEFSSKILDQQSGILKSGSNCVRRKEGSFLEHGGLGKVGDVQVTYGDSGGASRFFYCAKAAKKEKGVFNNHPTVKPIKLMEYLVTLVTPSNGIVLDPFTGSGTTLKACKNKGFKYIGFERESQYIEITTQRLESPCVGV
ncbi:site-specific DNA-methyltransferase [Brevibacillus laterosporus]|nr:site-specific DNA-methyltransferase [Brevibacillus laterosporus]